MGFTGKRTTSPDNYDPTHLDLSNIVKYLSPQFPLLHYIGDNIEEAKSVIHVYGDKRFNEAQWFRSCVRSSESKTLDALHEAQNRAVARCLTQLERAVLYGFREVQSLGGLKYNTVRVLAATKFATLFSCLDYATERMRQEHAVFNTLVVHPNIQNRLAAENCTHGMPYYQSKDGIIWVVSTESISEDHGFIFHSDHIAILPLVNQSFHYIPMGQNHGEVCGAYTLEVRDHNSITMMTDLQSIVD